MTGGGGAERAAIPSVSSGKAGGWPAVSAFAPGRRASAEASRRAAASDLAWPLRWDYAAIVALFVASRAFLAVVGYVALKAIPSAYQSQSFFPDLFVRWDSLWYISLAQSGYSTAEPLDQSGATNFAFYPAYPALMWLVSHLTGLGLAAAGILISNAAFLAALFVLYALGREFTGSRLNGLVSVLLICFVPEGFVFSAVYTESIFVLVTAASMLSYSRGHYLAAGLLSAFGSSIRSNGVFIALWYGLEILRKRGFRGALRFWKRPEEYFPALAAPVGLLLFWWLCYFYTGDAFAQKSTAQFGWAWMPDWPWHNVAVSLVHGDIIDRFWVVSGLVAVGLSFTLLLKGHWTLFVYSAANFLLYFSSTLPNSLLRYSIAVVPVYFGLSYYVRGPRALLLLLFPLFGGFLMVCWAIGSVITI